MNNDFFYVLSFESTNHAIQTEKLMKERFRTATIPTPREITHSCGISIKFLTGDLDEILGAVSGLSVPFGLYRLSEAKTAGKRTAALVHEHQ